MKASGVNGEMFPFLSVREEVGKEIEEENKIQVKLAATVLVGFVDFGAIGTRKGCTYKQLSSVLF